MTTPSVPPIALAGDHISHERAFHIALVLEMSELSDRSSPEDEPKAMVADSAQMAGCIERALERADLVLAAPSPSASSVPLNTFEEYRRGLREAFNFANMINVNRQGRTAEETCAYMLGTLADLANGYGERAAPANLAPSTLTDEQIDAIWNALPGIKIHNEAGATDTYVAMRRAFARALLQANGATHE